MVPNFYQNVLSLPLILPIYADNRVGRTSGPSKHIENVIGLGSGLDNKAPNKL